MTYAFDPELAPWVPRLPRVDLSDVAAERSRRQVAMAQQPRYEPPPTVAVVHTQIPGPAGAPKVAVRVYTPIDRDGELPGFVYLHGGGFMLGDVESVEPDAAEIAATVGAVVVSVDYRLAPEHPFPAGFEDCYAALRWTADSASELRIDPERIGIGGDSAGGGLAAAVALAARDRGGPALCFQLLNVPELDDRLRTPSMRQFVDTPRFDRMLAELSWRYYLDGCEPGGPDVSPYAAPARAEELSGLPPAFVTACEFDPLRDEDIEYATRLLRAGVNTELHVYPGTFHGSTTIAGAAISQRMWADYLDALRRGLRVP